MYLPQAATFSLERPHSPRSSSRRARLSVFFLHSVFARGGAVKNGQRSRPRGACNWRSGRSCAGRRSPVGGAKRGAEEIGVGVEGNAAGRGVVAAEVADDTEPPVRIIGDRATNAVLVDAPESTQAEIGVADGGVDGLGARRKGKEEQPEAKQEQSSHRNRSFRA